MFPFKMMIFHSYVSLPEGNCFQFIKSRNNVRIGDPGLARGLANWFMLAKQKRPPPPKKKRFQSADFDVGTWHQDIRVDVVHDLEDSSYGSQRRSWSSKCRNISKATACADSLMMMDTPKRSHFAKYASRL